jgi:hypothetical protein
LPSTCAFTLFFILRSLGWRAAHEICILNQYSNQLAELKARRFVTKAAAHEAWTAGKDVMLTQEDYANTNLGGVVALKKKVQR